MLNSFMDSAGWWVEIPGMRHKTLGLETGLFCPSFIAAISPWTPLNFSPEHAPHYFSFPTLYRTLKNIQTCYRGWINMQTQRNKMASRSPEYDPSNEMAKSTRSNRNIYQSGFQDAPKNDTTVCGNKSSGQESCTTSLRSTAGVSI